MKISSHDADEQLNVVMTIGEITALLIRIKVGDVPLTEEGVFALQNAEMRMKVAVREWEARRAIKCRLG
jgi:hypothetical protein